MTAWHGAKRQDMAPWVRRCVLLLCAAMFGGCALTPRRPPPPELINSAVPAGFAPDIRLLTVDRDRFAEEIPSLLKGLHDATAGGSLNILVLSGGGSGGAFGAGALVGLGNVHAIPSFQVVTGVSAGALIAPFAFSAPPGILNWKKYSTVERSSACSSHGRSA